MVHIHTNVYMYIYIYIYTHLYIHTRLHISLEGRVMPYRVRRSGRGTPCERFRTCSRRLSPNDCPNRCKASEDKMRFAFTVFSKGQPNNDVFAQAQPSKCGVACALKLRRKGKRGICKVLKGNAEPNTNMVLCDAKSQDIFKLNRAKY